MNKKISSRHFIHSFNENKTKAIHDLIDQSYEREYSSEIPNEEEIYCQISTPEFQEYVDFVVSDTLIDLTRIA